MQSKLVITFLPRSKRFLISWHIYIVPVVTQMVNGGTRLKSGQDSIRAHVWEDFSFFWDQELHKATSPFSIINSHNPWAPKIQPSLVSDNGAH